MKVSAQYAATHFDDILSAATNGEEVEIAVPDKPTLKLIVANPLPPASPTRRRVLGAWEGQVVAQALEENLTIVSAAATLAHYPAAIIWS